MEAGGRGGGIEVDAVEPITPHNKALVEAGKEILQGLLALAAPLLYLAALGVFAYGYFPGRGSFSLEDLDSISRTRDAALDRRYNCALVGMILFALGVLATLGATMYFFSLPAPAPASVPASPS